MKQRFIRTKGLYNDFEAKYMAFCNAMDAANANVPATGAPTTQAAQSNPSEQSPAAQTSQAAY